MFNPLLGGQAHVLDLTEEAPSNGNFLTHYFAYIHTKQLSDLESSFLKYSYFLLSNLGLGDERTHLWPNEPIGDHEEYTKPPRIGIGYEIGHYGGQEVLETIK